MENRQIEGQEKELVLVRILREAGFRDGEAKGLHDGEIKGEVKNLRDVLLRGVMRRGLVLTDEQEARIRACNDRATLDRWFDNVFDAKTADELFR